LCLSRDSLCPGLATSASLVAPRATTTDNNLYDQDDHDLDPSATWSHAVSLGSMYGDF
jgi:hypothetical protein